MADFFKFTDAAGHPFSGTGGLTKFAEGLVNIDVQNQIVFVFDNDAEGEAYGKVGRLKLPGVICVGCVLFNCSDAAFKPSANNFC